MLFLLLLVVWPVLFAGKGDLYRVAVPVASVWDNPDVPAERCQYPLVPSWCAVVKPAHHGNAMLFEKHDSCVLLQEHVVDLGDSPNPQLLHVSLPAQLDATGGPCSGYVQADKLVKSADSRFGMTAVVQVPSVGLAGRLRSSGELLAPFGAVLQHREQLRVGKDLVVTRCTGEVALVPAVAVRVIPAATEPVAELRAAFCANLRTFVGTPYVWGGRSMFLGADFPAVSGVDCSGLVSVCAHSVGLVWGRNVGGLAAFMQPINPAALQAGDLIALLPTGPGCPRHVMVYLGKNAAGQDEVIEAAGGLGLGSCVRVMTVDERLRAPLGTLQNGMRIHGAYSGRDYELQCGSFFADPVTLQAARDAFLDAVNGQKAA